MLGVGIRVDLRPVQRSLGDLTGRQLPFATSLALNMLAKGVAADEVKAIDQTFQSPTPFTERAFRTVVATKSRPIATVAVKDPQAQYLRPYIVGGDRFLGKKKGMLAPRAIALNQYGNLPKGALAKLKAKPGIFIGAIRTNGGKTINGVWQRPVAARSGKGRRGTARPTGGLKLLIQFEDTTPVPVHLPFYERARSYVARHAAREFESAFRRAIDGRRP